MACQVKTSTPLCKILAKCPATHPHTHTPPSPPNLLSRTVTERTFLQPRLCAGMGNMSRDAESSNLNVILMILRRVNYIAPT